MEYKEKIINEYAEYLKVIKANSPQTILIYTREAESFFSYILKENVTLDDVAKVTPENIYDYLNHLADNNVCTNTRARAISALKSFFEYARKRLHLIDKNPAEFVERPKIKKALPKYATVDEATEILNHVSDFSRHPERDYCILVLFLNCGLRVSELVNLNVSDIDFSECTMKILGKGNKERLLFLNKACIKALEEYLYVKEDENEALFVSQKKERISVRATQELVKKSLKAAGLEDKGLSTHKLRHSAATMMYQGGVDLLTLCEILGHENLNTTRIYTHISDNQKKEAMFNSPLSNVRKSKK